MTYTGNLWLFLILLTGIIIVPGMDMLFVLANALTGGRRAGLAATSGIMAGGAFHTLFGTVAVAALSRLVPALATAMVLAGSVYMIWIGVQLTRSSITVGRIEGRRSGAMTRIFGQGLATCLLNPKAWLFVLAVYPQFLNPSFGPLWSQAVVMGLMTVLVQLTVYGGLALAAACGRDALASNPAFIIWLGRGAGLLLIGVAVFGLGHRLASL